MKLLSMRGLFAAVASVTLLTASLAGAQPLFPADKSRTSVPAAGASVLKLHEKVPYNVAQRAMQEEGWIPVMSGYALKDQQNAKSIFSLWKKGESGKWRVLHVTWDGKAQVAYEGAGLKLISPKNPYAKPASAEGDAGAALQFNTGIQATPANHPHAGVQACGEGLIAAEQKLGGLSVVAEGIMGNGSKLMTISANYLSDADYAPVTWTMYVTEANTPSSSCRIEAGYGIVFNKGFNEYKPPGYMVPVPK